MGTEPLHRTLGQLTVGKMLDRLSVRRAAGGVLIGDTSRGDGGNARRLLATAPVRYVMEWDELIVRGDALAAG